MALTDITIIWLFGFIMIWFFFFKRDDNGFYRKNLGHGFLLANSLAGVMVLDSIITFIVFGACLIFTINAYSSKLIGEVTN